MSAIGQFIGDNETEEVAVRSHEMRIAAAATALALLVTGCGDDEKGEARNASKADKDPPADYCALAAELHNQEEFASPEQLEALQAAAPPELQDEYAVMVPPVIEAIRAGNPRTAFDDPKVDENFHVINQYDAEACGLGE